MTRYYRFSLVILLVWLAANCSAGGAVLRFNHDICFKEDTPGANDRYVEYTPVRCSDKSKVLGEPFGGEYASLEFEDTDADGVPEIIVSSEFRCRFRYCLDPRRTVIKVKPGDQPEFIVVKETVLPGGHE